MNRRMASRSPVACKSQFARLSCPPTADPIVTYGMQPCGARRRTGGGEDLLAVADGRDGLARGREGPDQRQHALVQREVLGRAAAGDDEAVVSVRRGGREVGVELEVVPRLLAVGLVTLEIVDRGAADVASFFVGADGIDHIPIAEQGLERYHYFIVFHVIATQDKNLLLTWFF